MTPPQTPKPSYEIVCPWCNYECLDSRAVSAEMEDGDSDEINCESCHERFSFTLDISTTYIMEQV